MLNFHFFVNVSEKSRFFVENQAKSNDEIKSSKYAPFAIRKDEIRSLSIVVGAVRME